jgi:DNA-binding IclR family transcriptional regulator
MQHATAIDKVLDVLFHVGAHPRAQGVSEIGRALGLPKSSAHRLLSALKRRQLVEQDESGRYRPGAGLVGLTGGRSLLVAARPVLEQAATALGETFFLVVGQGGRLVVLDKAEGTGLLRGSPQIGSAVPVHATAVGKLYLAHAPASVQLEKPLVRYTPRTIVDAARLAREVQSVRTSGHAVSHGEWIEGLSVAAAAVLRDGNMLGAVCAAVPSGRMDLIGKHVVRHVESSSGAISARLGGSA